MHVCLRHFCVKHRATGKDQTQAAIGNCNCGVPSTYSTTAHVRTTDRVFRVLVVRGSADQQLFGWAAGAGACRSPFLARRRDEPSRSTFVAGIDMGDYS